LPVDAYFIQYKFIVPKSLNHSSYTYQKLFRALYGYTQAVYKSNGKTYKYHRKGVLSDVPFLRPTKNTVIIPVNALQKLLNFFNTGENPAHRWTRKGEWKAVYYMNEKKLNEQTAAKALENMLDRIWVDVGDGKRLLLEELRNAANKGLEKAYVQTLLQEGKKIISNEWFPKCYVYSKKLVEFKKLYDALKK
jgi:UDP-N-acetylmuramoylalanine-D-glutamate ligase